MALRGDGSRFPARINCLRVVDGEALPMARIAMNDVSPLRQAEARADEAEKALRYEEGILQAVMSGARAAHLAYLDRDFNFIRVSELYADTGGYSPEQLVGKNLFALYPDPEVASRFAQARDTGMATEYHDQPCVCAGRGERETTYWDWTLTPVKGQAGEVRGLMYTLVETTQRVQREAERIRSLEEQRDSLVREVHHRIKNHLQGVVGLIRARIAEEGETFTALEKTIDQIGTIAKAYDLQSDGKDARTTVEQLVRTAVDGLPCPIEMEVRASAETPPSRLAGDETVAMALVVNELLTNAVKHSPADARVRIRVEEEAACSHIRVQNGPAFLPGGFDWASGTGLGTGLELLRSLIPGKGARLSYRQENDMVVADLALSVPVIDRERREAVLSP